MRIGKFLGALILALSVFFLGLQFKGLEIEAAGVRALSVLLLTVLYIIRVESKHLLFLSFLVTFSIAEVFNYFTWAVNIDPNTQIDYFYYIGNIIYILSYLFLLLRIIVSLNIKAAVYRFPIQTALLTILGVFFVYFVSDTTRGELDYYQYYLEFSYNATVMLLLAFGLINYMYKDDKKSMNLLIGTICIMFSEVIQLAYFYIADFNVLNVLCSLFLVFAFLFFYLQSRLKHREIIDYSTQDAHISE